MGGKIRMHKQYLGLRIKQRQNNLAIYFFAFAASAKDIIEWAAIDRVEEREGGIQRRLSQARLRAIYRFFDQDKRNIIPTGVIVAFKPGATKFSRLDFPKSF